MKTTHTTEYYYGTTTSNSASYCAWYYDGDIVLTTGTAVTTHRPRTVSTMNRCRVYCVLNSCMLAWSFILLCIDSSTNKPVRTYPYRCTSTYVVVWLPVHVPYSKTTVGKGQVSTNVAVRSHSDCSWAEFGRGWSVLEFRMLYGIFVQSQSDSLMTKNHQQIPSDTEDSWACINNRDAPAYPHT